MYRLLLISVISVLITGCGSGFYSVIYTNPGVHPQSNVVNDLPAPYKKREVIVPYSIGLLSEERKKELNEALKDVPVHTVKVNYRPTAKSVIIELPQCDKKGIAILKHHFSKAKLFGKRTVEYQYACIKDDDENIWAATDKYLINGKDDCEYGFHTVELIFNTSDSELRRVMAVCADE